MNEEEKDLQAQEPQNDFLAVPERGATVAKPSAEDTLRAVEIAFKRAERMTTLALSRTRPNDWTDIGGKPYLQASGAVKMLHPFGISVSTPLFTETKKTEGKRGEPEVVYDCQIILILPNGQAFPEIGSAASSDDFFCKRKNKETKEDYFLSIGDVDLQDVRKKSYANALGRAIRRVLALENLTWDDLEKAGIKRVGGSYDFKKGGQEATGDNKSDDRKRQEIREMLLEMAGGEEKLAREILERLTMYNGHGLTSVDRISDKALNINHRKAKAAFESWQKDGAIDTAIKAGLASIDKKEG